MHVGLALMILFFVVVILTTGFRIDPSIGLGMSVKNVLLYPLFLIAVLRWYNEPAIYKDNQVNNLLLLFAAFVLYCIFSLAIPVLFFTNGYDLQQGVLYLKGGLVDPFVSFIVFWVFTKRYLKNPAGMLKLLLVIVAVFCFLMIIERMVPSIEMFGKLDRGAESRSNGPFGEKNQTAAVLSLCLPLAISLIFVRSKARIYYAVIAVAMLMCIVFTASRGGILGSGTGCLYLLWAARHHLSLSNKLLMIAAVPVLGILAWFMLPESNRELILLRFSFINESDIDWDQGSSGRTYIWEYGLRLWKESPIFGQGWGAYQNITGHSPHSVYLDYAIGLGIVGLAIALFLYWKLFRFYKSSIKLHRDHNATLLLTGMSAGLIGLLVSLVFVDLYLPFIIVWCILGAAAGYSSALKSLDRIRIIRNQA